MFEICVILREWFSSLAVMWLQMASCLQRTEEVIGVNRCLIIKELHNIIPKESMQPLMNWSWNVASTTGDFYDYGIHKLVPSLNKCLVNGGNFVEK